MKNLPARVPSTLFPDLVAAYVSPDTPDDAVLELVVVIEGENIPAREFADYLSLIDRLYGRMSPEGLRSYVQKEDERLKIAEIHKSDLEIIFRALYGLKDSVPFILILLFLRSLPNMFKIGAEAVKNLADAYKSYEEGRLARENRKRIREGLRQESALANLDDARKRQLAKLLDALVAAESANLSAPIRFARRQVRSVILRIKKQNPPK